MAQITGSQVAGVAVKPLGERMKSAGGWMWYALTAAAMVAGFGGGFGLGASFGIERYRNHLLANDQKRILTDHYKDQVAATLGIAPDSVTTQDLEAAARANPMVASAIAKVEEEKSSQNRMALLQNAGVGAVTLGIPGLTGIANLAAHAAGGVAGMGVSSLFDKDILFPHDVMENLDAKEKRGEMITPHDIITLRIAQDEAWQKAFAKQYGIPFHKMNEHQQKTVINSLPSGAYAEAQESIAKLANGQIKISDLLMPSVVATEAPSPMPTPAANENTQSSWVARTGGQLGEAPKSFTERFGARTQPASFTAQLGERPKSFTEAQVAREATQQQVHVS